MHRTSLENMHKCVLRYSLPNRNTGGNPTHVLDIGGADINGSYRPLFPAPLYKYQTADIAQVGADIILKDPYLIPLPDCSIDLVISGQMLEHCEFFWLAFQEMVRLAKPDGFIFLIAPSAGPIHRYPVDCYRFYPDAYDALARYAHCHLVACWQDERGPWRDLVGVFRKTPLSPEAKPFLPAMNAIPGPEWATIPSPPAPGPSPYPDHPDWDLIQGQQDYLTILQQVHAELRPGFYLEIGIRHGASLALAQGDALGIDPDPVIDRPLPASTRILQATSDDFFEFGAATLLHPAPDLVFIDGMHLFEYALRDFMNVERHAKPTTLVFVDDIFPNHPVQADRERRSRVWTGDVWKLLVCLSQERPDLILLPLDTRPTGLLLIAGLDHKHRALWDRYNPIVNRYGRDLPELPPENILCRHGAYDPDSPIFRDLIRKMGELGRQHAPLQAVQEAWACLLSDKT